MHPDFTHNTPGTAFSVHNAVTLVQTLLHQALPPCWVEGEVSNMMQAHSGHRYFSLKDGQAQLHCVLFHRAYRAVGCHIENGMMLKVWGQLTVYPERGQFQMQVKQAQPAGDGELQRALETLKAQWEKAGLFDAAHKRALPPYMQRVGIISSPVSAALQDILRVLGRRCPDIDICIYPSLVQGENASTQLIQALTTANTHAYCDALILARGGGSLEDLWAFNHPDLALAIHHSTLPVITGIGHETDWTLADGVSDKRAATPSAAAEQVSADTAHRQQHIYVYQQRLLQNIQQRLLEKEHRLHPLQQRITSQHPERVLSRLEFESMQLTATLKNSLARRLDRITQGVTLLAQKLQAHNPQSLLAKGYVLVSHCTDTGQGKLIKNTQALAIGQCVHIQWATGHARCQVLAIEEEKKCP